MAKEKIQVSQKVRDKGRMRSGRKGCRNNDGDGPLYWPYRFSPDARGLDVGRGVGGTSSSTEAALSSVGFRVPCSIHYIIGKLLGCEKGGKSGV
jgi:hypothetical protein